MAQIIYAMDSKRVLVVKCTSLRALDSYRKKTDQPIKRVSKSHVDKVKSTVYGKSRWKRTAVSGVLALERA